MEYSSGLTTELAVVAEFLLQSVPFDQLDEAELHFALKHIQVEYQRRGDKFRVDSPGSGLRILRSGAVDLRDSDNKLLDRLGEGESFHIAGLNAERGEVQATVIEDALIYRLPDEHYRALRERHRAFDRYSSGQRSRRLRRAARYQPEPNTMMQEVSSVMSTDLVTVDRQASIQQVAGVMAERRV